MFDLDMNKINSLNSTQLEELKDFISNLATERYFKEMEVKTRMTEDEVEELKKGS